jgi:uridine kinase
MHFVDMNRPVYIIAVAGPSCAGKTELAKALSHQLRCSVLPLDHYYRDLSALPPAERAQTNFDVPSALEDALLIEHVSLLSAGHTIGRPVYDFATHTRVPRCDSFRAERFLIIDGLFTLYWDQVRNLAGTKVFVDAPDPLCLSRRIVRDVRERGRTEESVIAQFTNTVQPMAELYVRPTRQFADLVLSGEQPLHISTTAVIGHIRTRLGEAFTPTGA